MRYYAGIGSRDTPPDIKVVMSQVALALENCGYILRSGGAKGADLAFESGVQSNINKEIYLPWKGFNDSTSELYLEKFELHEQVQAFMLAEKFYHSRLSTAPYNTKRYMTSNSFQICGLELTEFSDFVICWTKDGKASGGTGQAIRIAEHYNIPVFNLKNAIDRNNFSLKLLSILKDDKDG